ncbi:MAG: monofunctional biosynthetic peptidoglycan transglycosylase [Planktomarina sp.]|nr:monofunctional biosynthetic peptidoglycan transglycosylase [Planktomarina sp.]MDT2040462.1 monofunctional biosynthetic peptidoglycan transglycosylase [Planktomarina sp.]
MELDPPPQETGSVEALATPQEPSKLRHILVLIRRWSFWSILLITSIMAFWGLMYRWVNPPTTLYIIQESQRLGEVKQEWVDIENVSPVMVRALVAAEDANFCYHWGIDSAAVRKALKQGAIRGGSTISQQVVKNAFLWPGRSWLRKAIEALMTPYVDLLWNKRRMLEVYLNIAEFDTGIFGIQAAAQHHFGVNAKDLNRVQAARLAVVLPDPKGRSAIAPSKSLRKRASSVIAGSDMIRRDGRSKCFED